MSIKKVIMSLFIGGSAGIFVPLLLTPLVGSQAALFILFGGLIVYLSGTYILGRIQAKQGNRNSKILPPTNAVLKGLKTFDAELLLLGFKQVGVVERRFLFQTNQSYFYMNHSQNIMAYTSTTGGTRVRFSSYLADGFDVSTDYPIGTSDESRKIVHRVVKSSLGEALDYHKHHVNQRIAEHGASKQFPSIQDVLDWEDHQALSLDSYNSQLKLSGKIWLRMLVAFILASVATAIVMITIFIGFIIAGYEEAPPLGSILGIINIIFVIIGLIWSAKPLYKPETVEDRKKKEFA